MAAFRKQVTQFRAIDIVQQIVEDQEARSAARVFKICRDALVKIYVPLRQFCRRGNSGLLVIAPNQPAVEIPFRTQGVDVLQEPYAERDLPEPLAPHIMHANGCLNLMSSFMDRQARIE